MSRPRRQKPRRAGARREPRRDPEDVLIERIGQQGDGEGSLADGTRVFVPVTLPGEKARVQPRAKRGDGIAAEVIERLDGPAHATPFCPVYGRCGGCQLQHVPDEDYVAWKRGSIVTALRRQGISLEVGDLQRVPLASRRRARLSAIMTAAGLVLGFNAARADNVIDINTCPLFAEPLAALMTPLRELLRTILRPSDRADVAVTALGDANVDILVISKVTLDLQIREQLAAFAAEKDIARISWELPGASPEPVVARHAVVFDAGGVAVEMPGGGFLQPSDAGEAILRGLVMTGVGEAKRLADLYCGIGTFALPLAAAGAHVVAIDGAAPLIAGLNRAAGQAGLGGHIEAQTRDLAERPLELHQLEGLEAVIFDPPRAGAKTQAEALAGSAVPKVVAVSCNPSTLARDLRILLDGGYRLDSVVPVDQFPMSYHVEAVATLTRPT